MRPGVTIALASGLAKVRAHVRGVGRQMAKFGMVGVMALVIDIGAFNALRYVDIRGLAIDDEGWLSDKPITAKVISAILATMFAYAANRWWTFRDRGGSGLVREVALFFLLNGIASLIAVACLGISHYALGLDNPTADNASANVIGLALGTMFRWWSYRRWVFPEASPAPAGLPPLAGAPDLPGAPEFGPATAGAPGLADLPDASPLPEAA